MADEVIVATPEPQTQTPSPFSSQAWSEETPKAEPVVPPPVVEPPKSEPVTPTPSAEEIIDPKEWLKREFEVDDPKSIKEQLAELKTLREKANTPAEIKYANDQSKLFHEALIAGKEDDVYNFLHEKRRIDKLVGTEVNKLSAEEIVKYGLYNKNKSLTTAEVDFLYNKRFSFPEKPVKELVDTNEEFASKLTQWEKEVKEKETELLIEAKMILPEIQKLKTELKLPEIQKSIDPKDAEANQKELDRIDGLRKQYLQYLDSDYRKFNGYEIKYKDEDVEIPVSFGITPEEQDALKTELATFNIDGFISERWFNKDGTPNITQLMSDVTLLRKGENVFQKIANEVGAKMKDHYIKLKSNINLNGGSQNGTFQPAKNGEKVDPFKANSWTETPTPVNS